MCACCRNNSTRRGRFPRNTREASGQCAAVGAENSAAGGTNCRGLPAPFEPRKPHFIVFFTVARTLLIPGYRGWGRALRHLSELLPCCLLSAPRRPHWTLSNH